MKKRLFPMEYLRLSQIRFNLFSHKNNNAYDLVGKDAGIDNFYAPCELIVIGVFKYETTGFSNTVHFYDRENDVTIALTHMDDINSYYYGQLFKKGDLIYKEGTKGKATGKHIHCELGQGRQLKKKQIMGVWRLINQINIEDYFYVDKSIKVLDTKGITFEFKTDESEGKKMFKEGQVVISDSGLDLNMYFQKENQRLGMISASNNNNDFKAVKKITDIDDDRLHVSKMNCGYFEMSKKEIYGQHYGVEITPQVDLIPRNSAYVVVYVSKGFKKLEVTTGDKFYLNKKDVEFACSPYCVLFDNGNEVYKRSIGLGNKDGLKNQQSFLIQLKSMQCVMGVVTNKVYPKDVLNWAKAKFKDELMHLSLYDSGGSSQITVYKGQNHVTGRAIANVLTFYKVEETKIERVVKEVVNNSNDEITVLKNRIEQLEQDKIEKAKLIDELNNKNTILENKLNKISEVLKS